MTTIHPPTSRLEICFLAFCLLFLESLYFKITLFIHDYLNALLIVSYALLGLGIGALMAHRTTRLSRNAVVRIKLVMILSIGLSLLNFIYWNAFLFLSPVLVIPFAAGNMLISHYLKQDNAYQIYFMDLLGAASGVVLFVFLVPLIREENGLILLLALLVSSLCFNFHAREKGRIVCLSAAALSFGCFWYNLAHDPVNLARITRPPVSGPKDKIYAWGNQLTLIHSKGSNVQRIDVLAPSGFSMTAGEYRPPMLYVAFNGLVNDVVRPETFDRLAYRYDPRLIYGVVHQPHVLVIGTSAEGVVKTAAAQGGRVTGLEINPQIVDLMQGPLFDYSKKAYALMEALYPMDARTFFLQNNQTFDILTLMNTHMGRHAGLMGTPEFLHTREALNTYMDHLSEEGFVVFEEKYYGDHGRLSSIKIISTILHVLQERGIENPRDHLFVYHWILNGLSILGDPEQPMVSHVMIVVKKQPFASAHWTAIHNWADQVERYYGRTHEIIDIYPVNKAPSEFSDRVHAAINDFPLAPKAGGLDQHPPGDFSLITDDKPFPWSVDPDHGHIKAFLCKTGGVALVLLGGMLIYWFHGQKQKPTPGFLLHVLYFGLIGFAYFILEIGLMNFYQIFLGSPTYAFVFIIGTLLLSSGMGSYFAAFLKRKTILAFGGILILSAGHLFLGRPLITAFGKGPLYNAMIIAITLFPLGFLMGIPFPLGIETIKEKFNQNHATLFFAVNCIFSSFAVIASFYLSVAHGFTLTFAMGLFFYVTAFLIFMATSGKASVFTGKASVFKG